VLAGGGPVEVPSTGEGRPTHLRKQRRGRPRPFGVPAAARPRAARPRLASRVFSLPTRPGLRSKRLMHSRPAESWAEQEFGSAKLGDLRRTERLKYMGRMVAERPAGKVTEVFERPMDREAAYRFLESSSIDHREIAASAHRACAERAAAYAYVFVSVDGTSLNFTDRSRAKGLGVVGTRKQSSQGIQVMSGLVVSPDGVPLGLSGMELWTRKAPAKVKGSRKHDRRRTEEKETRYWQSVMSQTTTSLEEVGTTTLPWFQLDRGGDAWPVLLEGFEPGRLLTVRAAYDRLLWGSEEEPCRQVREKLEASSIVGEYTLAVKGGHGRRARVARMEVRAAEVTLRLVDTSTGDRWPAPMHAVLARETADSTPEDERPLEWLLLTTFPVESFADAELVLFGYSQRWRIEDFHRLWKTGACRVEDSQLGDFDHLARWAVIQAAAATFFLRLTHLARHQPELPATVEFEASELKATIMLRKPAGVSIEAVPTIGEVVLWISEMGGYTGKSSGGPPGAMVLARGLQRVEVLAGVLTDGWEP